ncbi:hypothetical protein LI90_4384 (plasmid) [Carbonactinospora thermoautotrophica]|uniref:Uncharacterized protein n=1 Tax=Carbonactinospora thermoautotrophica TaxID=1469144 RepID=A0A132MHT3_9ACTN|nr:hypothetical protein LI90_4384 [Carbonactinospora thermoautotrophica]
MRLRVEGDPEHVAETVAILREHLAHALAIEEESRPYRNRNGRGVRVYLTAGLTTDDTKEDVAHDR